MTTEDTVHHVGAPTTPAPASEASRPPEVPVLEPELDQEVRTATPLEALEEELGADVDRQPIILGVPLREGYEVRYSTDFPGEVAAKLAKASRDKSMPGGINNLMYSARILATQCAGIIRRGEEVVDQGYPLTFRSPRFLDLMRVGRPVDAVLAFYASDGHVIAAAEAVSGAAGYGEELPEGEDPTTRG